MPKPGPRPYECVKRAWHSDRHQAMRGSVIQRIFSVVSESHSPATKDNKEWQLKLPFVVFKSEEIMYSKANSEAEYSNDDTLWDRLNDAINTIIRRDESTETGELLPPCVEAALNLGCFPMRATRSQRHNNPMNYLSPRAEEPPPIAPPTNALVNGQCHQLNCPQFTNQSIYDRPTIANSSICPPKTNQHPSQNYSLSRTRNFPFWIESSPPSGNLSMPMEANSAALNLGSVYPLYHSTQFQSEKSWPQHWHAQIPQVSNPARVLLGVPIGLSIPQPTIESGILPNLLSQNGYEDAEADLRDIHAEAPNVECDLSLRLGLFPDPKR